ncbi:MAG: PEP-utilizing enzyme, partial [Thermodesulfobacteriota bacterium]
MIFYGTLGKILIKWGVDDTGGIQNDLLAGDGGIISTEPIHSLQRIAERICADPALAEQVRSGSDEELVFWFGLDSEKTDTADPAPEDLRRAVQAHLHRFGNRCVNELKLETITPLQEPQLLVRLIREYAALGPSGPAQKNGTRRRQAEDKVMARIKFHPLRRAIFRPVLALARRLVRNRENLRFERTRLFGVVRRIFLAIGDRFASESIIDHPRDVFYLTKEEIFSFIEGTAVTPDLKSLIAIRKKDFEGWKSDHPPDRFDTFGMVYHANTFAPRPSAASGDESGDLLKGTGCCPGVIRGTVRKVQDPTRAEGLRGNIMVAKRTDPGWAAVFPIIQGMIIERGSLLSHSAIVAREMSIPTVVGVKGCFDRLKDGETVELDGTSGTIRRIDLETDYGGEMP